MEKISHIVRGNARVSSVDLKSGQAARPGAPTFGRPVGESPTPSHREETTAERAVAIQQEMADQKKQASIDKEKIVAQMSENFFMSRLRRPAEPVSAKAPEVSAQDVDIDDIDADSRRSEPEDISAPPKGYTPRGSYVNVRA